MGGMQNFYSNTAGLRIVRSPEQGLKCDTADGLAFRAPVEGAKTSLRGRLNSSAKSHKPIYACLPGWLLATHHRWAHKSWHAPARQFRRPAQLSRSAAHKTGWVRRSCSEKQSRRDSRFRWFTSTQWISCSTARATASSPSAASQVPSTEPATPTTSNSPGPAMTRWTKPAVTDRPTYSLTATSRARFASMATTKPTLPPNHGIRLRQPARISGMRTVT